MNTLLVNCRSIKSKLSSLTDNFDMNKSTVALLTETWLTKGDKITKKRLESIEMETGIRLIRKDRNSRGGDLAIAFNTKSSSFQKIKLKSLVGSPFEILAAGGKIHGFKKQHLLFSCYIPPRLTVFEISRFLDKINWCYQWSQVKIPRVMCHTRGGLEWQKSSPRSPGLSQPLPRALWTHERWFNTRYPAN